MITFKRDKETGRILAYKDGKLHGELVTVEDAIEGRQPGELKGEETEVLDKTECHCLTLHLSITNEISDNKSTDQDIKEVITAALKHTGIVDHIEFIDEPARVLSIDEIMVPIKQTDRVYIESRRNKTVLEPVFLWNPLRRRTGDEKRIRALGTLINDTLSLTAYNIDWRAWNKRPTEEEREKAAWRKLSK